MVYCLKCGTLIEEDWDSGYYAREMLCIPCYDRKQIEGMKKPCRRCGVRASEESGGSVRGSFYCGGCKRELEREIELRTCFVCKRFIESYESLHQSPDGKPMCEKCFQSRGGKAGAKVCSKCGKAAQKIAIIEENRALCERCYADEARLKARRRGVGSKIAAAFALLFIGD
jgi:hypothetical protein